MIKKKFLGLVLTALFFVLFLGESSTAAQTCKVNVRVITKNELGVKFDSAAEIYINGNYKGFNSKAGDYVSPGTVTVKVKKNGQIVIRQAKCNGIENINFEVELKAGCVIKVITDGVGKFLGLFNSNPEADIFINDRYEGRGWRPWGASWERDIRKDEPGYYTVRVKKRGYVVEPSSRVVYCEGGKKIPLKFSLTKATPDNNFENPNNNPNPYYIYSSSATIVNLLTPAKPRVSLESLQSNSDIFKLEKHSTSIPSATVFSSRSTLRSLSDLSSKPSSGLVLTRVRETSSFNSPPIRLSSLLINPAKSNSLSGIRLFELGRSPSAKLVSFRPARDFSLSNKLYTPSFLSQS